MWDYYINATMTSMTLRHKKIKDIYQSIFISLEKTVAPELPCHLKQALGGFKQNITNITFLCLLFSLSSGEVTMLL